MRWNALAKEDCSLARTLAVVGDRWTLLILRDAFLRVRRFEDFETSLKIARRVLTERLALLVAQGILKKVPYQERPLRHEYRLTQKGIDLYPVVMSIVHWGDVHMAGRKGRPLLHQHVNCGKTFDPVMTCSACGEPVNPRQVHVRRGPGAVDPRHLPSAALVADAGKRRATPASRAPRSRHQKSTSSSE